MLGTNKGDIALDDLLIAECSDIPTPNDWWQKVAYSIWCTYFYVYYTKKNVIYFYL